MKKINLYDYQQEMLENITKALTGRSQVTFYDQNGKKMKVGNSVMVQMPTGTGKTYVMAAVVKWFLEKYEKGEVWLIAHRKELVEQMQQTLDRLEEDMVMVKTASTERKRMTDQELKVFKKNVKPFLQEDTMRMGLKSGNEIVLRPIYPYISPFRGDHAIFRLNNHNYLYGVLDRLGYIVVAPEYQSLNFLNAHTLVGRKPHSDSESINL